MTMHTQKTLGLSLTLGVIALLPGAAQAQTCGSILTANTTLTGNLVCTGGNGLELAANNITLDCAGFSITGIGTDVGILLDNTVQATVVDCTVDNFAVGFRIDGGNDNKLSTNVAVNNQSTTGGFSIINGSTGNVLVDNEASNNVGRGFSINASDKNILEYNAAYLNGFRGFDVINASYNYLHGNVARSNTSAGMIVQDYLGGISTGNLLDKNYIVGSGSEGLAMFASGNTVQYQGSDYNGTWGIRDTSGAANTYISNTCVGNPSGTSSPAGLCF